jgi:hypothetical protein
MFRASILTSAVGGLTLGSIVSLCEPVAKSTGVAALEAVAFLTTSILLVGGAPQIREYWKHDAERMARDPRSRPDFFQNVSDNVDEFYLPALARGFTYMICFAAIIVLLEKR